MIGYFFNNITPMAAGGQPFQIYHLTKIGADAKAATNIVVSRYLEFVFTSLILLMLSITRVFAIGRSTGIGAFVVYVGMGTTLGMTLIVLFMLIRPQSKKRKEQDLWLSKLQRGDTVITQSGIFGKIVGLTDKVVTLEVAHDTRLRILRSQIMGPEAMLKSEGKEEASRPAPKTGK